MYANVVLKTEVVVGATVATVDELTERTVEGSTTEEVEDTVELEPEYSAASSVAISASKVLVGRTELDDTVVLEAVTVLLEKEL